MNKRILSIAILLAVVAGAAFWVFNRPNGDSQRLRVSVNLPLSGPIAVFMDPIPNALRMGLEEEGKSLGLEQDFFSLNVDDNAGKPAQAVTVFQKQNLSGFDVYMSGSTEMTMAIVDQIDEENIPHFLIAFDAYMTGKGENRIRILPNYKLEGPMWVEYAKKRKAKKVFALTLNNPPIEEEFAKIVSPGLAAIGVELKRERFEWDGTDYRTLALKIKEYDPDLVMVSGYSVHLYPALNALRSQGIIKDGNTIAALDFVDLLYNDTPKAELANVAFMCPAFELSNATAETQEWRKAYEARFGSRPSYVAAYAFDTGRLLAKAWAASEDKRTLTVSDLLSAMPMTGVSGQINVDEDRDLSSTLTIARLSSDNEVIEIE